MTGYEFCKCLFMAGGLIAFGTLVGHTVTLEQELTRDSATVVQNSEDVSKRLEMALGQVAGIETDTQRTEAEMAGLLNATRHSMLTEKQVQGTVDHANEVLSSLDTAIKGIAPVLAVSQTAIGQAAQDIHATAVRGGDVLGAAAEDLSNPDIAGTLRGVSQSSQSLADTSAHLDKTAADIQKIADAWSAPVKGFWNHLKLFLREVAGPAASVVTAVK